LNVQAANGGRLGNFMDSIQVEEISNKVRRNKRLARRVSQTKPCQTNALIVDAKGAPLIQRRDALLALHRKCRYNAIIS
jgi:hypothetical protein